MTNPTTMFRMKCKVYTCLLCVFLIHPAFAKPVSPAHIRKIIEQVNGNWQTHNKAETRAFWDNAAYHTGNMEAYFLTGNEKYRAYSEAWASYNGWMGAKGQNRQEWKYTYGESDEYVLFGDYQACFQTYIDLYQLTAEPRRIARAREVMEYEINTPRKDYLWWSDGLYMVMPVLTKLYKATHNQQYLDKLYEYVLYADSIMLDTAENLYYRDARYVYPKHATTNGKKDFWARGDGWVLAGLAKVLKDLPADYRHRGFFVEKFTRMAAAVAALQQPGGYWSRSLMDAAHAPGPETSGTAFFLYGLTWGINNGHLDKTRFAPVVSKAWDYLEHTALQPDGTVGFVQPIGDRAVPGQLVDAKSTSSFGVGAFLLAACEYVRFLEAAEGRNPDREYWSSFAYKLAAPVLSNLAQGKLQQNMAVELSPSWDGRNKRVAYMEAFGRLMAGIAPWLSLPNDGTKEAKTRAQLRNWALQSYRNAVDPHNPDYLLWRSEGQTLVDAAFIAESFLRGYDALWVPLDSITQKRYIEEFQQLRRVDPPYTNWLLFSSVIESFLAKVGAGYDAFRISIAVRKVEEWYVGDGWYADGPSFAFDYYSSYVFHPMYLETLQTAVAAHIKTAEYRRCYDLALRRAQKYALLLERFISPEGTFPVFGRSIPYRLAALQPLALMAWYQRLPEGIGYGQTRSALTAVMKRMFDNGRNFNSQGFLTIGFTGSQANVADFYTNNGSLYMTSLSLMPLGLPAAHPFWSDAPGDWTSKKAWSGQPFPKDHHWPDEWPGKGN
jgi:rhamnogalacturonyl hydrolase YesR